tara:strand:- start:108425 stop:110605 length:2181 start_codon:yes stop_codon:yes gene_type:complete
MKNTLLSCVLLIFAISCTSTEQKEDISNKFDPSLEPKVTEIVNSLSLEEKGKLFYGNGKFWSAGIERLGFDEVQYTDGPLGIREELERHTWNPAGWDTDQATFFPAGGGLSATWNTELAYKYGKAMGAEARARNKDYLLAPAVNIQRSPLGGRNYEYFTEDPVLNSEMAVPMIKGIQSEDVAATIKHYAINNQETLRGSIDVQASERAIREIYLPVFKAAVTEADVYSVMCSYNRFRGPYVCENEYLLKDILKGEWGFKGTVMSDWGATHSTVESAMYGLDIEMGDGEEGTYNEVYLADPLIEAVENGEVPESIVDDMASRIVRVLLNVKKNDPERNKGAINTPEHHKLVYDVASESIVLLKNEKNLLPLNTSEISSIAVIGDNATQKLASGGFGAGVKVEYEVTPLEGLKNKLPENIEINFAQGYDEIYDRIGYTNFPKYEGNPDLIPEAIETAKNSDMVLLFIGGNRDVESEAHDRETMELPFGQDALVKAVTAANPNTVIVMVAGTPFDMREITPNTSTIVWSWFNGTEAGNAIADILLGNVNPSGKLPFTIPEKLEDSPAHATNSFPGNETEVVYEEGILVGYRWFDTKNITPMFPFGFGLSYTTFEYGDAALNKTSFASTDEIEVKVPVTNTGDVSGKETVQVYVRKSNSAVERPDKELKGFTKVEVQSGQTAEACINFDVQDLAYFDESTMSWKVESGEYEILIGSSSRDIQESVKITIK